MTSCLIPMGELAGKHLVTIEGLEGEQLSTVQRAIVECAGTQCGYCTPGLVMSMTGWTIDSSKPLDCEGLNYAISGNFCRCTGYRSIKAAGQKVATKLSSWDTSDDRISMLCEKFELPRYFLDIEERLRTLSKADQPTSGPSKDSIVIVGGTDFYLRQGHEISELPIHFINQASSSIPTRVVRDWIHLDARMSFERFGDDLIVQEAIPGISGYNGLIASWPVRTRATLGGNLCNASPNADIACLLLALEAEIELITDTSSRFLPLKDFYLESRKLNKSPEEIISTIRFPKPSEMTMINWEKVSKRPRLDIATVNSAIKIAYEDKLIVSAKLALGGVFSTPLFLSRTSAFLEGRKISVDTTMEAASLAQTEICPVSDVRGSADYKRLLARQLILAHFSKGFPRHIRDRAIYETLR